MSKLQTAFESASLKERVSTLLESIDRNNTSKFIAERILSRFATVEVSEGSTTATDAYTYLMGKGVDQAKAKGVASAAINESTSRIANPYLIEKVNIMRTAIKELSAYSWMPVINDYIKECNNILTENEFAILVESVIFDLENHRESKFYAKAITKLRECSNAENPVFAVSEDLDSEKWIPLVKQLVEYADKSKGSVGGSDNNYKVSKVYSPVIVNEEENTYTFYSNGKMLTLKGEEITESEVNPDEKFKSLLNLMESSTIVKNGMRFYPKAGSILDVTFEAEGTKITVDGKLVEAANLETHLLKTGLFKFNEIEKVNVINRAIAEGANIKEMDFAYRVESKKFKGVSTTVFTIAENIFIQKVNPAMKVNEFVKAESAESAVSIVKEFMNYDITNSLTKLIEAEEVEKAKIADENSKIERKIQFLQEKLEELNRIDKLSIYDIEHINKAKAIVESEIATQTEELTKKNS
jgi:hypothetical protein